jgi:hypothetical protein
VIFEARWTVRASDRFVIVDTWKNGKVNKVFLAGAVLFIASFPLRFMLSGTELWMRFATWLTNP